MIKLYHIIVKIYKKYQEIINYLFFGMLATLVNFIIYLLCSKILNIDEIISSALAWLCAVMFAYITNKIFVFSSKTNTKKEIIKEIVTFAGFRILTGVFCEIIIFAVMIRIMAINDVVSKIITQILVVILNYVFSKLIIFRNGNKRNINEKNN